ncbi:MAG: hypothetical protein DBY08_02075 [Clostridiales bacterium]|nr:hypothetical protein [Bacillota bacterium]PWL94642.1 MAG: hypothetical protein DBY08_02075 [Clostridiales bacterium]
MEEKKIRRKKIIELALVIVLVGIGAIKIGSFLPTIGALDTPANTDISMYYINHAMEDTHAQNIVTAVLADYRSFDTLFETCVMLLSGVAVMVILSDKKKEIHSNNPENLESKHITTFGSSLMDGAFRIVMPIILIYGIYVLFHGEVSLGGGFQAGALISCAYLLDRIIPSFDIINRSSKEEAGLVIAASGTLLYVITGIIPMFNDGRFLEFGKLPFTWETIADLHADGILMIEIGVTICVAGVIITILEAVLERTDFND